MNQTKFRASDSNSFDARDLHSSGNDVLLFFWALPFDWATWGGSFALKEIPKLFFAQVLLEAWGATATTNTLFEETHVFLALVPQASKKPLGQKTTSGSL